ncbi:hypothetical protein ACFLUZ_04115 [Chloroflexota bacterium]
MDKIGISFDIDWAPDEVIQYVFNLLAEYQVKTTCFATHNSALIKSLDNKKYEIGIHPNFNDSNDYDKTIKVLKAIYPEAIGVRSHGLLQSSNILQLFLNNDLKYDVNTFIPLREGLYPFTRLNRLVCIPYFWEDDANFSSKVTFELEDLQLHKKGLKIYNFHPMHVFMNTKSSEHYNEYKQYYQQPDMLTAYKGTGKGTQTLFIELLQYLNRNKLPGYTCEEIYREYLKESIVL